MLKRLVVKLQHYNPNVKKVLKNSSWLVAQRAIRIVLELFVGIWLARYLGVEEFGIYIYALSFVDLFAPLFHLGLPNIVVRDIVRQPSSMNEILGTTFILKLIGAIISFFLALSIIMYLRPGDTLFHVLIGIIAVGKIVNAFEAIDFWFQSQIKSKYVAISKITAYCLVSLLKVFLIKVQAPLIGFVIAFVLETVISSIMLVINYRVSGLSLKSWSFNIQRAKSILNESWPVLLSATAIIIQSRIDQVMLGQMINESELGQYSVAMRLIEAVAFVPGIICQSMAPVISKSKLISNQLYYDRLTNLYRLMFIIFVITAVPIFIFSRPIVLLLYGQEYTLASQLLPLFSIRLFFTNFGVAKNLFIANDSLFLYSLITGLLGAVTNIVCNYILIPRYASIGALWATIFSFGVMTFVSDIFYPRIYSNFRAMIIGILTPFRLKINSKKN
ncbi:teichoic acid transporter [Moorena producens PAL-8-15-08-1]|uniref:Teichoic acid transporter n=1 Tax=Moorena producens PAL-8-15-08-1 TaxID=1458985 RepID=A0A1D8U1C8_9CYAN|nr:flippase [Moorena producens]AOX03496.1 teichoic acid transporter [Moorena producens PAL-8-15-08-1]